MLPRSPPWTFGASAASALTQPNANADLSITEQSVPTIAPGGTGTVTFDITNNGPDSLNGNDAFNPLVFVAPPNTTFAGTWSQTDADGTVVASNAALNGYQTSPNTINFQVRRRSRITPSGHLVPAPSFTFSITVSASAPASSTLAGGTATWNEFPTGVTWTDSNQANNVNVPWSVKTAAGSTHPDREPDRWGSGGTAAARRRAGITIRRRRATTAAVGAAS